MSKPLFPLLIMNLNLNLNSPCASEQVSEREEESRQAAGLLKTMRTLRMHGANALLPFDVVEQADRPDDGGGGGGGGVVGAVPASLPRQATSELLAGAAAVSP